MDAQLRDRIVEIAETAQAQRLLKRIAVLAEEYVDYFEEHSVPVAIKIVMSAAWPTDNADDSRVRMWLKVTEGRLEVEERDLPAPANPRRMN